MYLLTIDAGNTNTVYGVFAGERIIAHWRVSTDAHRQTDEYAAPLLELLRHAGVAPAQITRAIIASVVPALTPIMASLCRRYFAVQPLVVSPSLVTGLTIHYDRPQEVGADRIADAVAARHLYGTPAIVIDFGTATTFDAIDAQGDYLGGAITPGIVIATDALFDHAARLYRVEFIAPPQAIGHNTMHSLQSGIVLGYVGLVEAMTARFRAELGGTAHVIGTGGLCELIARETTVIEHVDPLLTLHGLRLLAAMNERNDA